MAQQLSREDWTAQYPRHLAEWTRRFTRACEACRVDGAVIFSGTAKLRFRDDTEHPFVPEPYFKAWCPFSPPNAVLRILPGETPLLAYLQQQSFWEAPAEAATGFWTEHFELRPAADAHALFGELGPTAGLAALGEDADASMGYASVNDPALLARLDYHRAWKTGYEVACLEEANRIAAAGHTAAAAALTSAPVSELRLSQIYCDATRQRETELPYLSIVALNEHGSTLHYQHLDRNPPGAFRSFLLDAGARFNGYASDVTRTHTAGGPFAALIESMDTLQKRLCAGTRAGVGFTALNDLAHKLLAEVLTEHRLVNCGAEEAYAQGITRTFLPHGLGHLLGLQVHDPGGHFQGPDGTIAPPPDEHPFLRLTRTLEPGFVVTIEPGLYFIPSLLKRLREGSSRALVNWDLVEGFIPFGGIRIEDDVLVTDGGSRNLSRPALMEAGLS